jgi:hypothetical protein
MDKDKNNALALATQNNRRETIALLKSKGATTKGAATGSTGDWKSLVGTWEGPRNQNPYAVYRFVFKSDMSWTYSGGASSAFKKAYPDQFQAMDSQFASQASMEGSKGTFSLRDQYLVLKTDSVFSSGRVYAWQIKGGELKLNGGEFVLSKVVK